jgi:hypothetical protein
MDESTTATRNLFIRFRLETQIRLHKKRNLYNTSLSYSRSDIPVYHSSVAISPFALEPTLPLEARGKGQLWAIGAQQAICAGRHEVEDEAGMPGQPLHHLRVLVGGVVVECEVNDLADRHLGLDGIEEADELVEAGDAACSRRLPWLPGHSAPRIGWWCRGLVIMGHGAGAALLHGQAGLGAVERLDLALLVHRQHDRMRRRIDVEADHVLQLDIARCRRPY